MKPSAAQLRQLKRENLRWPEKLAPIPREEWAAPPFGEKSERQAVLRSRRFLVQVFDDGGTIRLSVIRTEWDERAGRWREGISWDELQQLKAEAGYPDLWAVELYPADHAVVNVANMRHIWLLGKAPSFGWNRDLAKAVAA